MKKKFIDKILSLFDEYFDKIGKTIAFAYDAIDSAKSHVSDIVTSFKGWVEIISKISYKITSLCWNIINLVRKIKNFKISQIPEIIDKSKESFEIFDNIKII